METTWKPHGNNVDRALAKKSNLACPSASLPQLATPSAHLLLTDSGAARADSERCSGNALSGIIVIVVQKNLQTHRDRHSVSL